MILLDTCVISEVLRPAPSPKVTAWLDSLPEEQVYIPSLVIGELEKGVELLPKGEKKAALRLWLEQLRRRFKGRILPFDEETAVLWGSLTARCRKSGRRLPVIDSMLAAIALRHSALFATRNVTDYDDTGADIVNPWA
ncbi:MAG: type II toxin-antitoxin system VapC family toxin [Sediminispirochaetaceae bacterium]